MLHCALGRYNMGYTNQMSPNVQQAEVEVVIDPKCLSIGTPKTINFPFVPNGKLMVFRCPNI